MRYFARTTAGLEEIVWLDMLDRLGEARLRFLGHRVIHFDYAGAPEWLLNLRGVDDIYVHVATVPELDHTRVALKRLQGEVTRLQMDGAFAAVQQVRSLGKPVTLYVTASYLGRRNYSRYEIQDAVAAGILQRQRWQRVESSELADIDVRVLLDESEATIGVRLQAWPLHRRPYKVSNIPGSLKSPVAYCLCLLANVQSGDSVLDPFCGAGTIGLEAAHVLYDGLIINSDVDEEALRSAVANSAAAKTVLAARHVLGDARGLPIASHSVAKVVSNLPWGRQVQVQDGLAELYEWTMRELQRILAPGGRAVLLTDQSDLLLQHVGQLKLALARQISLYGSYPTIHVLDYGLSQSAAFGRESLFAAGLEQVIERAGVWQAYSPLVGKVPG